MALGNEHPRDEPPKSKTRSLTALGQSLRRGLTTKRSAKPSTPHSTLHSDSAASTNLRANERAHGSTIHSSNTLHSSFAKTTGYTPSPLSREAKAAASMSSATSSSTATLGMGMAGTASRPHRVGAMSGSSSAVTAPVGSSAAAGNAGSFRKTVFGSMGYSGMSKTSSGQAAHHAPSSSSALGRRPHNGGVADLFANTPNGPGPGAGADSVSAMRSGVQQDSKPSAAGNRDFSYAHATSTALSARSSNGTPNLIIKEGYLSKKTDINPSTSIASALSRGWKVYRVVLKGAKLFFYKPPSESELRAMFPEEVAAAANESAGGYVRSSVSTIYDDGGEHGYALGLPVAPGEVEQGSRAILFEPGVHDGEITDPLCDRYSFGECFTEVDLRSLKFKRYVCVLIFDDTLVVLKRRWVRQGLASSFFGAVSNKMRFGKGSRAKNQNANDNSSLVSAELGIQGKGYFTKWKHHASYPLKNVEAIEAASSRFSINHAPGVLGHLGRESQAGSGRISLYSIGNSSVSSVMTRTSTVSKDYSGALSSGVVPGFQIFVGGKERVARMFVATTSDAKNNWLSRFAAAKASYARKLRQRPRDNNASRRFNGPAGAHDSSRPPPAATRQKSTQVEPANADDQAKQPKESRTRLYWGTQRHPELVVAPKKPNAQGPSPSEKDEQTATDASNPSPVSGDDEVIAVGGSKSALVHEMVFLTTAAAASGSSADSSGQGVSFNLQLVGTYEKFMDTSEFLREFQRYAELVIPEIDGYKRIVTDLSETILAIASTYSHKYTSEQIGMLKSIVASAAANAPDADKAAFSNLNAAIDRMVPVAAADALAPPVSNPSPKPSAPTSNASRQSKAESPKTGVNGHPASDVAGDNPLRMRSKTHHGEPDPVIPQIPTVPELMRVEITGLSPSLLLRVPPSDFAHQLYLFHKEYLTNFDPKQASLYMPEPYKRKAANVQPTPSLLTVGASSQDADNASNGAATAPVSTATTATVATKGGSTPDGSQPSAGAGTGAAKTAESAEGILELQRQLMVFTPNEPHFITRLVHHHLLVELPLNRPARRSALLQHWVRIGEECRIIGDAVSWAAIAMAVTMSPISRLRETWHGVALAWKELIASKWVPLLVEYGIYETDIGSPSEAALAKPLVIKPQNKPPLSPSAVSGYTYTPIPFYGPIRMFVTRQGCKFARLYEPAISAANNGDSGDKVLFAPRGQMYAAAKDAVDMISDRVVERARSSIMRSRASTVSLATKYQQNASHQSSKQTSRESSQVQLASQDVVDPSLLIHPYLHAYFNGLACNLQQVGGDLAESDSTEYDLKLLLSISLQCEPSVADQYQRHLQDDDEDSEDAVLSNSQASAQSALRQAPGSILPLVCPETVPSTNILQWITPTSRTPVPVAATTHAPSRSAGGVAGRAGTFSHTSPVPNSLALVGTESMPTKRKPSSGQDPNYDAIMNSEGLGVEQQPKTSFGDAGDGRIATTPVLRHKRSRSFPANVPGGFHAADEGGAGAPAASNADSTLAASPVLAGAAIANTAVDTSSPAVRAEQKISISHNDAMFVGANIQAAHGDLSLKVLRVQYTHVRDSAALVKPVGFVVEVQGGTLTMLLDLLINGIERHSATVTGEKGMRIQFMDGSTPKLLLNRDVFQRTFMASFRHFCIGHDLLDAVRRALASLERSTFSQAEHAYGTLLDICENWLNQHFRDFLDSTALRESMTDFLVALESAIKNSRPSDQPSAAWAELYERAGVLLPELISQMLTPSGYSPLDKVLERRLEYAVNIESKEFAQPNHGLAIQSPLTLLGLADPSTILVSLNRLAQTYFAKCSFNDWLVAFCLLEVQTHAPLPWYAKKRISYVPSEEDIVVSDIYQVLEQTHRHPRSLRSHELEGSLADVGVGVTGVSASSVESSLVRTMPYSIQTMLELHKTIRGWAIRQIAAPGISLSLRIQRIQTFLTIIRLCRNDSQLSSSRVFGGLLNSYMREAGMIPERQPSYRVNSTKGYGAGRAAGDQGRRGKRKGAQAQIKYVPSFVERAIASALVSPESREYIRAWNEVATENNTKLDTLEAVLRGARDWSALDPAPSTPTLASSPDQNSKSDDSQQQPADGQKSASGADEIDLPPDAMARADCFVPCLGWLLENMVSLCYDTPDTLVGDSRLVNMAKRHRVFIMLCVCDQLGSRCQDAFAIPTKIRIDLDELTNHTAQTPLSFADIKMQSQNEIAMLANDPLNESHHAQPSSPSAASFSGSSSSSGPFGSNDRSFSFSAVPAGGSAGAFVRPGEAASSSRYAHGGFAKRSIANLRSAAAGTSSSHDLRGAHSRKAAGMNNLSHLTPDLSGSMTFGSPPAQPPRTIGHVDSPTVGQAPLSGSASSGLTSLSGLVAYSQPFLRLVTDEIEKVRQEIREREKLERELRDREQAIERQKSERTKMLKRQLKEQQQRRAKNEPLRKMANLMNKVGISTRESSIDAGSGYAQKATRNTAASGMLANDGSGNIQGSATDSVRMSNMSAMRPRGPALPNAKPANVINLINSTITVEQGYTKRDFVFRIVTEEGGQYLLQAPDREQMEDWINGMRDAATEAAARRLTLFVEEAKKRTNGDSGAASAGMLMGMGEQDSVPGASHQQQQSAAAGGSRLPTNESARSRFTAFLGGGSSAFGGAFSGSQAPPMPSRNAMSVMHANLNSTNSSNKEPMANIEPKSFGIDLAKLMPDPKAVPTIIEKCLAEIERRGLEEVGIYRVSGAAADVSRLRQLFNIDPDAVDLSSDEFYDINVVSGVTKQFLRELPEPLMTYNLYDGFINAASIDDYDERLWAIKDLVHALPTANYTVLKRLVEHLERVTDYEEINHMYGTNLALVFGPSLLRPPPGSSSFALAMSNLGHAQSVIKNLILQYHWIFNVEEEAEPIEDGELAEGMQDESADAADMAAGHGNSADAASSNTGAQAQAASAGSGPNTVASKDIIDEADEDEDEEDDLPLSQINRNSQHNGSSAGQLSPKTRAEMDLLASSINKLKV